MRDKKVAIHLHTHMSEDQNQNMPDMDQYTSRRQTTQNEEHLPGDYR